MQIDDKIGEEVYIGSSNYHYVGKGKDFNSSQYYRKWECSFIFFSLQIILLLLWSYFRDQSCKCGWALTLYIFSLFIFFFSVSSVLLFSLFVIWFIVRLYSMLLYLYRTLWMVPNL
jgi:hypothetical protein